MEKLTTKQGVICIQATMYAFSAFVGCMLIFSLLRERSMAVTDEHVGND